MPDVSKPAPASRSFKVDVYEAPTARERKRGVKPKPLETFMVTATTHQAAGLKARRNLAGKNPGRRLRSFSSNSRTGGFVAYYNEGE